MGDRGAASTVPPQPAARGARACLAPTTLPTRESARPQHPQAAPVHPQRWQSTRWHKPPRDPEPAGCHAWPSLLQAPGTVQRSAAGVFACAPGLWFFVLLQRLCWHGKGTLGVTAPARDWDRDPGEGAHPWLGVLRDPRARKPSPAVPTKPAEPRPWGTAGRGCRSSCSSPLPGLSRGPGGYFWLCITSQLTLPPSCHSPATYHHPPCATILARPRTSLCPPATLGRPGCQHSVCQPLARRPGPAGAAHRFASRRLAVMPGARSAGGRAAAWRAASPSHVLPLGHPRPKGLRFAPPLPPALRFHEATGEKPQSVWHRATVKGVLAPAPACPWVAPTAAGPPPRISLSPSAHLALRTAATRLTHRAAPAAAGVAEGSLPSAGAGDAAADPYAGGRLLQCRGLALPTPRARAAARTPTAGSPCRQCPVPPTQAEAARFCCPLPLAEEPGCLGHGRAAELWVSAAPASVLAASLPPPAPQGPGRTRGTSWVPRGGPAGPLTLPALFAFARALPLL